MLLKLYMFLYETQTKQLADIEGRNTKINSQNKNTIVQQSHISLWKIIDTLKIWFLTYKIIIFKLKNVLKKHVLKKLLSTTAEIVYIYSDQTSEFGIKILNEECFVWHGLKQTLTNGAWFLKTLSSVLVNERVCY